MVKILYNKGENMIDKEQIVKYFESIENEKFIYDDKPAKFSWSCNDNDNEHGVMGGYNVTGKWSGMGIPFSKNDSIEEIKVTIEKYLIIPKAKQMSLF